MVCVERWQHPTHNPSPHHCFSQCRLQTIQGLCLGGTAFFRQHICCMADKHPTMVCCCCSFAGALQKWSQQIFRPIAETTCLDYLAAARSKGSLGFPQRTLSPNTVDRISGHFGVNTHVFSPSSARTLPNPAQVPSNPCLECSSSEPLELGGPV